MRLYFDVCSLNRPYDNQTIDRNRLEAEAVLILLQRVSERRYMLVSSEVIDLEISACPDIEKAELVRETLGLATESVILTPADVTRFHELVSRSFRRLDAMHLAAAEAGRCDYLVTTDDKLVRRGKANRKRLAVAVVNPLVFVTEFDP